MALHPQARAYLDANADAPAAGDVPVAEARAYYAAQARAGEDGGPQVEAVADRTLRVDGRHLRVRAYDPTGRGPLGLVVYLHGGGWATGGIETHDRLCRAIARGAETAVLSVSYRLAPEHPFPAAADDALAAVRWAGDHARELGADAARLAVAGDSAGANLATVAALRVRDEGGPALRCQVLAYPIADAAMDTLSYRENASGYGLTRRGMAWYWAQYAPRPADRRHPHASPLRASSLGDLPPALVITAEHDPLRDEGEAYAARLADAGVPTAHNRYAGMIHGFLRMPELDACEQGIAQIARALGDALS